MAIERASYDLHLAIGVQLVLGCMLKLPSYVMSGTLACLRSYLKQKLVCFLDRIQVNNSSTVMSKLFSTLVFANSGY